MNHKLKKDELLLHLTGLDKQEVFNTLLQFDEDIRMDFIDKINESYGYEFINQYELARYELWVVNTEEQIEVDVNKLLLLKQEFKHTQALDTVQIAKDLQRGYMSMLTNLNA